MADKIVKRRHHIVPKFYLRRFANDRDQVTRVELPGTKRHPIAIGDATVEKDFYLAPAIDGGLTDAIEDSLSELEGSAKTAVSALLDDQVWPITPEIREQLAAWIAIQYLRTAARRQTIAAVDSLVVAITGRDGGPQHTLAEQSPQHPYRTTHLEAMLTGFLPAARSIYARGWTFIQFTRKALITSDTPVVLLPIPDADERTPLGLTSNGGIMMPLDRRVALLLTEHPKDLKVQGTTVRARAFNQVLASNAHRCLFHHPADDPLQGLELPEPQEPEVRWERWNSAPQE